MRSTETTARCAPGWKPSASRTCSRSPAIAGYPLPQLSPGHAGDTGHGGRAALAIEENFQAGKGLTGLDEHQVRRWTSWYRWVTLAMLAAAVLTIAAALGHARDPGPAELAPLTRNEIARLLATMIITPLPAASRHARTPSVATWSPTTTPGRGKPP